MSAQDKAPQIAQSCQAFRPSSSTLKTFDSNLYVLLQGFLLIQTFIYCLINLFYFLFFLIFFRVLVLGLSKLARLDCSNKLNFARNFWPRVGA